MPVANADLNREGLHHRAGSDICSLTREGLLKYEKYRLSAWSMSLLLRDNQLLIIYARNAEEFTSVIN